MIDSLKVKTIYLKFCDVDWDANSRKPLPVAKMRVDEKSLLSLRAPQTNDFKLQIIPTIFITNECIQQIDSTQIKELAYNIHTLTINTITANAFNSIPEVQFDCDWTVSTKDKYFLLLSEFKKNMTHTPVSATIRLHQVKYVSKAGVPPVDRGLLMCYNMGNLKDPSINNSIIETKELEKYTGNLGNYPLPLDIALPVFEWKVLFRNNKYSGLVETLDDRLLADSICIKKGNRYEMLKDVLLDGYAFKKGDILRVEKSDPATILSAAEAVSGQLKNTRLRVSLYHLDSVTLNKYNFNELESMYNSLR